MEVIDFLFFCKIYETYRNSELLSGYKEKGEFERCDY